MYIYICIYIFFIFPFNLFSLQPEIPLYLTTITLLKFACRKNLDELSREILNDDVSLKRST